VLIEPDLKFSAKLIIKEVDTESGHPFVGIEPNCTGRGRVTLDVAGIHIDEPDAYIAITKYPSHQPVLDQVYQLIGNEAEYWLGGNIGDWGDMESGPADNEARDRWILSELDETP